MAKTVKRPKWAAVDVPRVGHAAVELAQEYRPEVEPRLAAGVIDGLKADLVTYEGKRSSAALGREDLRAATRSQDEAADAAAGLLSTCRHALVRNGATGEQRAAFGLSLPFKPTKVSSLIACLDALVAGDAKYPTVGRACGLLPEDFESAKELRAALASADASQEAAKEARKSPTLARDAAHLRIERAVDAICAAGQLAFIGDPAIAARFAALVPARGRARASAPAAKAPAPGK